MVEKLADKLKAKVLVVGGGPGGYVAAIRAGQLGLDPILVDLEGLGGTCLQRGCIPSKALIHVADQFAAMSAVASGQSELGLRLAAPPGFDLPRARAWKEGVVERLSSGVGALLRKARVRVIRGRAHFTDARTCTVESTEGTQVIAAENVVLATGSEPVALPALPFGGPVVSSTQILALETLPARLAVVGAGYIGLELGLALRKLGVEVAVVEAQESILPLYDRKLTDPVRRRLAELGIALHLGARAQGYADGHLQLATATGALAVPADRVLVTVGRRPRVEGFGLENMAVDVREGAVVVDDQCRTSMRQVFAIGDLVGEPMLAHKASAQGEMVAEIIAGQRRTFDPLAIPAVCFTDPEIVSVGLSPEAAQARGEEVLTGAFPYAANGRALTLEAGGEGGFVRVVARRADHVLLGVQAVGREVSELSSAFTTALEMGARLEDVEGIILAHPTLGEAFHEAALLAAGHPLHL